MKLYICDKGDWSVGIGPMEWGIEAPIEKDDDKELREEFREDILKVYRTYAEGRLVSYYEDESEEE